MDDIITKADIRHEQDCQRLGSNNARCVVCGEDYKGCIEQHHIAGRAYDAQTAPLCRNCHRKQSDLQYDHPKAVSSPPTILESIGHYLVGLGELIKAVADRLVQYGRILIDMACAMASESAPARAQAR